MLSEFLKSNTATKFGIDNTPGAWQGSGASRTSGSPTAIEVVSNLQFLCREILEPLREWMNEPVTISSGYRCPKLNKAVGGATNSLHLTGEAADILLPSIEVGRKYLEFILAHCRFHQVIWEHTDTSEGNERGTYWLHVSIKQDGNNKQQYIPNLVKQ